MWWPTSRTTRLDEDISQHKECCQHPHGGGDVLEVATEGVEEHIAYQTDEDAVVDAEAEGHHHHRDEGRKVSPLMFFAWGEKKEKGVPACGTGTLG